MIFAGESEERSLLVFSNEDEAIGYCEGLDVEAAIWLFWDSNGAPLEAEFITPNKRGLFTVGNGTYRLIPAPANHHADLREALPDMLNMEPNPYFNSLIEVGEFLASDLVGT